MCTAIRFNRFEFTDDQLSKAGLDLSSSEVRVYHNKRPSLLPLEFNGNHILVEWGNKLCDELPKTGFCKTESLAQGKWQWLRPKRVKILATAGLMNGVWFQIRMGIQGILLEDHNGKKHVYIQTQKATHYFKVMTGAERMPVLIDQIL